MAEDITDRLRVASESASVGFMPWASLMWQARDEIIRLRELQNAPELEGLRDHAERLAAALDEWGKFADEYWPHLMCRPGTSALRAYRKDF